MRISDWSSDVCSSDLKALARCRAHVQQVGARGEGEGQFDLVLRPPAVAPRLILVDDEAAADRKIHALGQNLAVGVARGEGEGIAVERLALLHLKMQRSEEHTSELQSLMRISYAVFCLK